MHGEAACGEVGTWGAASRHLREHLDPLLRRALLHAHRVHVVVPAQAKKDELQLSEREREIQPSGRLSYSGCLRTQGCALPMFHVPTQILSERCEPTCPDTDRADTEWSASMIGAGGAIAEDGGARRPRLGALFGGVAVLVFGPLQSAEAFGEDRPRRQRLHEAGRSGGPRGATRTACPTGADGPAAARASARTCARGEIAARACAA